MVIDDSPLDLMVASKIIGNTQLSHSITTFSSAIKALGFLNENVNDATQWPDIILLDLQMPEMDGFTFLNTYRLLPEHLRSSCTVFILTSSDDPGDIRKAEANISVHQLIKKPLLVATFIKAIESI